MSNVLIGIIGVILFIGLSLAGAVILGTDFMTASSSSRAAYAVQQLQQAASAAQMYKLKTGRELYEGDEQKLAPRFLKEWPNNPYIGKHTADRSLQMRLLSSPGKRYEPITDLKANVVTFRVHPSTGAGGQKAYDFCKAIQEQATGSDYLPAAGTGSPVGCGRIGVMLFAWASV